jgi:hypothetical protein
MTLIVTFRRYIRMREINNIKKMIKNHFAFAVAIQSAVFSVIFNDKKQEQSSQSNNQSRKKKTCLCNLMHQWDTCFYLISKKRSNNWISNFTIQVKVDDVLIKDKNLKSRIEKVQKSHKNKTVNKKSNQENDSLYNQLNNDIETFAAKTIIISSDTVADTVLFACYKRDIAIKFSWILNDEINHYICNDIMRRVAVGLDKTRRGCPNPIHWWGWTPYFVQWVELSWWAGSTPKSNPQPRRPPPIWKKRGCEIIF